MVNKWRVFLQPSFYLIKGKAFGQTSFFNSQEGLCPSWTSPLLAGGSGMLAIASILCKAWGSLLAVKDSLRRPSVVLDRHPLNKYKNRYSRFVKRDNIKHHQ